MTVALGTLSIRERCALSQAVIADLETELADLPLPDDGYNDGGAPFPAQPVYTEREMTLMRQEVMQRFLDRQANLNLAARLFC